MIKKLWSRTPLVIKAIMSGFFVSTAGVMTWTMLGTTLPLPLALILMIGFLWAYLKFFSGHWGPEASRQKRAGNFRSVRLPWKIMLPSLFAIPLIVLIEQAGLIVTFRIMEFPASKFLEEYSFIEDIPRWAGWIAIIMISAVAGICEEVGFRGYMQFPLEQRYSPLVSISIVSFVFVLVHLHQAWSGPVLVHIFFISVLFGSIACYSGSLIPGIIAHFIMDVFNFSFWWTGLGGQFSKETLAVTGIDGHFTFWLITLILGVSLFVILMRRLGKLALPVIFIHTNYK